MNGAEVLLRCTGLTRRWGGLVAVSDVSLELQRGTVHAVIGTNGAGKSTLINMLSGELPPSAGRIELLGQDVMVSRTSQFMGSAQEVLVTSAELPKAGAHVLIYAKNTSPEDFQAALDGVSLNP